MADLAASDLTYSFDLKDAMWLGRRGKMFRGTIAFGDGAKTYPSTGVPLTKASMGCPNTIKSLKILESDATGYRFEYDVSADTLLMMQSAGFTPAGTLSYTAQTLTVTDDDCAASTGVAIYFHTDEVLENGSIIGHIESVTAGNADTHITINNGGPSITIVDDDAAATGGLQLYFDEDGANADERVLADLDLPGDRDAWVICSDGSMLKINDDDSASSNGVALYVDDDAANSYERLLFVSPTNAAGTGATDDAIGLQAPALAGSAVAAAALAELSGGVTAPAAMTLEVEVIGY